MTTPEPLVWLNGRFLPFNEAALPLHDAGFTSGATVVDNARTWSRKLFRWADHLARFRHDCEACFVPLEASDDELTLAAETLLDANGSEADIHLVTFASPGPLGFYRDEANGPPTLGMVTYPLPIARYRSLFTHGAELIVVHDVGSSAVVPPTVKHRSRMNWHVADYLARQRSGLPHAIAASASGDTLLETSVANLLAVIDGVVISPPLDRILDGISLKTTRELCAELGLPFREAPIRPDGFTQESELLLTGTGFGIAGVQSVNGLRVNWPGPVYRTLLAAWSSRVGVDIAKQFTG